MRPNVIFGKSITFLTAAFPTHGLQKNKFPHCPVSLVKYCALLKYVQRSSSLRERWTPPRRLFNITSAVVILRTLNH